MAITYYWFENPKARAGEETVVDLTLSNFIQEMRK